jgi:hypothetical protein
MTVISVPSCTYVADEIALDIMGWTQQQLKYHRDYADFPRSIKLSDMLVLRCEDIARWCRSRQMHVVRYAIDGNTWTNKRPRYFMR